MHNLTLIEIIKKAAKLETEIESLKTSKFSKLLKFNIKIKESELDKLNEQRLNCLSPQKLLNYFKQDKICLYLGSKFTEKADEVYKVTIMRDAMAKNWGYIVPTIRITTSYDLLEDEFEIFLAGGYKRKIFKLPKNCPNTEIMNYAIGTLQTFLFDNVAEVLDYVSMYTYISAAFQNLPTELKEKKFVSDSDWVLWWLKDIVCSLLNDRHCVLNMSFILNYFFEVGCYQRKNMYFVIEELKKILPKYPEELFRANWSVNALQSN